jgi:hypothetical protein
MFYLFCIVIYLYKKVEKIEVKLCKHMDVILKFIYLAFCVQLFKKA